MDKETEKLVKRANALLEKCKKYAGKQDLRAFMERLKHGSANVIWAYATNEKRRIACRDDFTKHLSIWIAEGLEKYGKEIGAK